MVGKYLYESHVPWQNYKSQHTLAKTKSDNTNTFAHHCRCYSVQRTKLSLFRGMILIFLFLTAQKALKVTFLYGARRKFSVQLIDGENAFELNNFGGMVIFFNFHATSRPLCSCFVYSILQLLQTRRVMAFFSCLYGCLVMFALSKPHLSFMCFEK